MLDEDYSLMQYIHSFITKERHEWSCVHTFASYQSPK